MNEEDIKNVLITLNLYEEKYIGKKYFMDGCYVFDTYGCWHKIDAPESVHKELTQQGTIISIEYSPRGEYEEGYYGILDSGSDTVFISEGFDNFIIK